MAFAHPGRLKGENAADRLDLVVCISALTVIQRSRDELVHRTNRASAERSDASR
jgi:hypothetical protein